MKRKIIVSTIIGISVLLAIGAFILYKQNSFCPAGTISVPIDKGERRRFPNLPPPAENTKIV